MHYTQLLNVGYIYMLKDYTAPKFFNGLYFECLLTDQRVPAHAEAIKMVGPIIGYEGEIWKPKRFQLKKRFRDMTNDEARRYLTSKYSH